MHSPGNGSSALVSPHRRTKRESKRSSDKTLDNNSQSHELLQEAVDGGAELVVLPEIWNSPYDNAAFPDYAEDVDAGMSESADALAEVVALINGYPRFTKTGREGHLGFPRCHCAFGQLLKVWSEGVAI